MISPQRGSFQGAGSANEVNLSTENMSAVEKEFIFDAVVGFLTSPIWNSPVRTFIEQNSLVFDADGENHEAYQEIHKKYKGMVETLLSSFLKDVGISEEQFMKACQEGSGSPQFNSINRDVFDQMWAAEDFEVFKRLMIQKNIELQLQALQLLQRIHNVQMPMPMPVPTPTQMPMPEPVAPVMDEDAIMQEVLRRSKEEFESKQKDANTKTEQELEKTIAESEQENKRASLPLSTLESVVKEETYRLAETARREQEELEKALQVSLEAQKKQAAEAEKLRDEVKESTSKPTPQPTPTENKPEPKPSPVESKPATKAAPAASNTAPKPSPVKSASPTKPKSQTSGLPPLSGQAVKKAVDTPASAAEGWLKSAKEDAASNTSVTPTQKEITDEELQRRSAYLKQQRDKLLALKRQEREKSLTKYTEQQPKARPTSSRAARRVTAGEQVDSPASKSSEDDGKNLAMRRALADCLKREVIDKH